MGLAGHCERLLCIGGCHFGSEIAAVVQSRGVAAKQGFRQYYVYSDVIRTEGSL